MSLVELLIVMGLFGVFFGLVYQFLVPMLHMQSSLSAQAGLQREALVAMTWLQSDLRATPDNGIGLLSNPNQTVLELDRLSQGPFQIRPQYETQLVMYVWNNRTLVRRTVVPSAAVALTFPGNSPLVCAQPDMLTLAAQALPTDKLMSRQVQSCRIAVIAPDVYQVDIELEQDPTVYSQPRFAKASQIVYLRNRQ